MAKHTIEIEVAENGFVLSWHKTTQWGEPNAKVSGKEVFTEKPRLIKRINDMIGEGA